MAPHPALCVGDLLLNILEVLVHDVDSAGILLHGQVQLLQLLLKALYTHSVSA